MARSAQRTILPGQVSNPTPQFQNVLAHSDGKLIARTLRVALRMLAYDVSSDIEQAQLASALCAGVWWPAAAANRWLLPVNGCMQIRFGSEDGIQRTVYGDLREGEYNLPPCSSVSVQVAYWRPGNAGVAEPIELFLEVADGPTIESTPLLFTARKLSSEHVEFPDAPFDSNDSTELCPVPPGAYAYELAAGPHGIRARGQTMNLMLDDGGFYAERNPVSGVWLPPTSPILLSCQRAVYVRNASVLGEPFWHPQVTFFVR